MPVPKVATPLEVLADKVLLPLSGRPGVPVDVSVEIGGRRQSLHLDAAQVQDVAIAMPPGLPFEKETHALVWHGSISCSDGFTPIFADPSSSDARYLGVRVKPILEPQP